MLYRQAPAVCILFEFQFDLCRNSFVNFALLMVGELWFHSIFMKLYFSIIPITLHWPHSIFDIPSSSVYFNYISILILCIVLVSIDSMNVNCISTTWSPLPWVSYLSISRNASSFHTEDLWISITSYAFVPSETKFGLTLYCLSTWKRAVWLWLTLVPINEIQLSPFLSWWQAA